MANVLIYKVSRRGTPSVVNMHVCFDEEIDVIKVLYEREFQRGTCKIDPDVRMKSFSSASVFDCMISFADAAQSKETSFLRKCNKHLVELLQCLEEKEAIRHCKEGFVTWMTYIGQNFKAQKMGTKHVIKVLNSL